MHLAYFSIICLLIEFENRTSQFFIESSLWIYSIDIYYKIIYTGCPGGKVNILGSDDIGHFNSSISETVRNRTYVCMNIFA